MKKFIVLVVAAFALAGCSNFVSDFGIPTVLIAPKSVKIVSEVVGGSTVSKLVIEYTVRTLPGSPGGAITSFNLVGGASIPGSGEVLPCEPSSTLGECPVVNNVLEITPPPPLGSIVVESYAALGLNSHGRLVKLDPKVTLY